MAQTLEQQEVVLAVAQLVQERGRPVTLTLVDTDGQPDPTETTTDFPLLAVLRNYSKGLVNGSLIQAGDKQALVAAGALPRDPRAEDRLDDGDGTTWVVVTCRVLQLHDLTVAYNLQVRQ